MIKVIPLGTGGAFTKYYHNNYVFKLDERNLLVDAGTTLRSSLTSTGLKETDITDIIITHLHSDHVGGLEEFAQRCKWIHNHKPNLWVYTELAGGLNQVLQNGLYTDGMRLSDYFEVNYVEHGFMIDLFEIEILDTNNLHAENMISIGLKVNDIKGNKNIIFTSDIAKHEEACFIGVIETNTVALLHDVSIIKNPVHSYLFDVVEFYKHDIDKAKIYGMHYQDDIDIKKYTDETGINFIERNEIYRF